MVTVWNPEEGWDDETEQNGIVLEWGSGEPVQRRAFFVFFRLSSRCRSPFWGLRLGYVWLSCLLFFFAMQGWRIPRE